MGKRQTSAERDDRGVRRDEAKVAAGEPTPEAEERARRLEEIRLSVVEEWRWRESGRD